MRTVDAGEIVLRIKPLIEAERQIYNLKASWNFAEKCLAVVESTPTVSAEPEWIPCAERLPKRAGTYLVTDHNGDIARYIFLDSESSKEYWMRCVKAWMPLPKPYKVHVKEISKKQAEPSGGLGNSPN